MTTLEGVDRLGRLYDWTAEERDHVAAIVAEARDTFAAADSEQARLAEWVLANCPGEPSQDGGVVDTVIRLITSARADGAAEERERIAAEQQKLLHRLHEHRTLGTAHVDPDAQRIEEIERRMRAGFFADPDDVVWLRDALFYTRGVLAEVFARGTS